VHRLPGYPEPLSNISYRDAIQNLKAARYLCSTTFNSRSIAGVSRIK